MVTDCNCKESSLTSSRHLTVSCVRHPIIPGLHSFSSRADTAAQLMNRLQQGCVCRASALKKESNGDFCGRIPMVSQCCSKRSQFVCHMVCPQLYRSGMSSLNVVQWFGQVVKNTRPVRLPAHKAPSCCFHFVKISCRAFFDY